MVRLEGALLPPKPGGSEERDGAGIVNNVKDGQRLLEKFEVNCYLRLFVTKISGKTFALISRISGPSAFDQPLPLS